MKDQGKSFMRHILWQLGRQADMITYEKVQTDEDGHDDTRGSRWRKWRKIAIAATVFAIITLAGSALAYRQRNQHMESPCGNSTAEAMQLGCQFDELALAWLPSECIDQELV